MPITYLYSFRYCLVKLAKSLSIMAIFSSVMVLASISHASIEAYQFKTPAEEQRFQALMGELRCPKCQNQNLAGSDAEIAKDLKKRTYELMEDGKSDNEIRQYMIERYGDFISYKPPMRGSTYLLWFGPFALLIVIVLVIVAKKRHAIAPATTLTPEESARLAELLKRSHNDQ